MAGTVCGYDIPWWYTVFRRSSRDRVVVTRRFIPIVLSLVLLAACGGAQSTTNVPTAPTSSAMYSQADVVEGSGADATAGKLLTVNYTGWIYDPLKTDRKGLQFETSLGATPFQFNLGAGQVIPGWDQGIVGA